MSKVAARKRTESPPPLHDRPKEMKHETSALWPLLINSDEEVKITVQAAADAALGDFTVKVIGHPTKGVDATNEIKVTIEKT